MTAPLPSANLLRRQLKEMQNDRNLGNISAGLVDDNIYEWEVMLMISDECKYYGGACSPPTPAAEPFPLTVRARTGGFFRARLSFPPEYPHLPPTMRFETPLWHPNSAHPRPPRAPR